MIHFWMILSMLPKCHGDASYEADRKLHTLQTDGCRKASYGHPTLSPGIFTIYCEHGVCYGFEVLQTCESHSKSLKQDSLILPFLFFMIMPAAFMCTV